MLLIDQIIDYAKNLHAAKNRDYGNSFAKTMDKYGYISAAIRLDDKVSRLQRLTKQDASVKSESVFDTWLDMFNYALMTAEYISDKFDKMPTSFDEFANKMRGADINMASCTAIDCCAKLLTDYAHRAKYLDTTPQSDLACQTAETTIEGLQKIAATAMVLLTSFDDSYLDSAYITTSE